ncbi:MAG: 1-deoxy-D-xylulose-5-phosphate reductoisomerase [Endomicrobiales bacterium]|nr:1-deoxy-D-xylulose-5-phosphate reductoisomerase [Endomicrobiales bacterium]
MKKISILGSTGSIGTQVLDVVRHYPDAIKVVGLSAHSKVRIIKKQILEFKPEVVSVWHEEAAAKLAEYCRKKRVKTRVLSGMDGMKKVASHKKARLVVSSVVGSIGLEPLLKAVDSEKDIALANKEALVVAGDIIMRKARRRGVEIIPVDSEHSAIFQCLKNEKGSSVKKIILTASGGPFYRKKTGRKKITVRQALAHPTWVMGPKITVDSATLMNKGLEAIEAHHLFGVPMDKIEIVIHPQSVVHSMVEFLDGSVIAQMSNPDMRLPIQYALTYPGRVPSRVKMLDLARVGKLEFDEPDFKRFPCLGLALKAGRIGGTMPAVMNAANEVAVSWFLKNRIDFSQIPQVISRAMRAHRTRKSCSIKDIYNADRNARSEAEKILKSLN